MHTPAVVSPVQGDGSVPGGVSERKYGFLAFLSHRNTGHMLAHFQYLDHDNHMTYYMLPCIIT